MALAEKRRAELLAAPYTRILAEHEGEIADLYKSFAEIIKSAREFWSQIAEEEIEHQRTIKIIDKKLIEGEWKFKRPKFMISKVVDSLGWIASQRTNIDQHGISMRNALQTALTLETNMLEAGFFNIIEDDSAPVVELFQSQVFQSKAHIQRIQSEAKRFKWRIMGSSLHKPSGPVHSHSSEQLKESIKAAQANMIGMMVAMEEAASRFYNTCADNYKETGKFWSVLGAEEMMHAAMLKQLYKILDEGKLFRNVDRFNRKSLEEMIEFILDAEHKVRHGKVKEYEALCISSKIEKSMAEGGFYSEAKSDSPEYTIIARRLMDLTKKHIEKIEKELISSAGGGEKAQGGKKAPGEVKWF